MRISDYKRSAKNVLLRSYGGALAACVTVMAANSLISGALSVLRTDNAVLISAYVLLNIMISLIVLTPLNVGLTGFFLKQADGRENYGELFHPFKSNLTNVVKICFFRELRIFVWLIVPWAAGMALCVLAVWIAGTVSGGDFIADIAFQIKNAAQSLGKASENGELYSSAVITIYYIMLGLSLVFSVPGIIKSIEYSMIDYILAENPDISAKDAFRLSKTMMKGCKGKFFLLGLSFAGWMLLGMMLCGVGMVFVIPYYRAAYVQFYLDVKKKTENGYASEYSKDGYGGDTFGI